VFAGVTVFVLLASEFGREAGGRSLKVFPLLVVAGGLTVLLVAGTVLTGLLTPLFVVTGRLGFVCTPLV